jgi:hypothetical protein
MSYYFINADEKVWCGSDRDYALEHSHTVWQQGAVIGKDSHGDDIYEWLLLKTKWPGYEEYAWWEPNRESKPWTLWNGLVVDVTEIRGIDAGPPHNMQGPILLGAIEPKEESPFNLNEIENLVKQKQQAFNYKDQLEKEIANQNPLRGYALEPSEIEKRIEAAQAKAERTAAREKALYENLIKSHADKESIQKAIMDHLNSLEY